MEYYDVSDRQIMVEIGCCGQILGLLGSSHRLIWISRMSDSVNKIVILFVDVSISKLRLLLVDTISNQQIQIRLQQPQHYPIDFQEAIQLIVWTDQLKINYKKEEDTKLEGECLMNLVTTKQVYLLKIVHHQITILNIESFPVSKIHNNQVSLHQKSHKKVLVVTGYTINRKLSINAYSIDTNLQQHNLIHHQLLDIRKMGRQILQANKIGVKTPIRHSYQYEYAMNLQPSQNQLTLYVYFYGVYIQKHSTTKIFELSYKIQQFSKVYQNYPKPKLYEIACLHENFILQRVLRIKNALMLCYCLYRTQSRVINNDKCSHVMIYHPILLYTKNLIAIQGIIKDIKLQSSQEQEEQRSQLSIISETENNSYLYTAIQIPKQREGVYGNPTFEVQFAQKPIFLNIQHHKLPFTIGISKINSQFNIVLRHKITKKCFYWKMCTMLPSIDHQDTSFIQNILSHFH